jgi:hypothetical protein
VLGLYWIAIALYSRWATAKDPESTRARWAAWILPWALSVDNITYGLVSGVPAHASVWFSAGEQTLSSAVQAGVGLLPRISLTTRSLTTWRRRPSAPATRDPPHRTFGCSPDGWPG